MNLQDQINQLKKEIVELRNKNLPEQTIRDIIFYDIDNATVVTRTATDSRGDTVVVPPNPAKYVRIFYKGKPYNVAVYTIA